MQIGCRHDISPWRFDLLQGVKVEDLFTLFTLQEMLKSCGYKNKCKVHSTDKTLLHKQSTLSPLCHIHTKASCSHELHVVNITS